MGADPGEDLAHQFGRDVGVGSVESHSLEQRRGLSSRLRESFGSDGVGQAELVQLVLDKRSPHDARSAGLDCSVGEIAVHAIDLVGDDFATFVLVWIGGGGHGRLRVMTVAKVAREE